MKATHIRSAVLIPACALVWAATASPVAAQAEVQATRAKAQASDKPVIRKAKPAKKIAPQFLPPDVQPGLPNVLLIGDSISIGYMLPARKALAGEANVWRPTTNCGPTTRGLESLEGWLGDRKWDVVHFNFGLHDLKYMGPKNQNLADPDAEGSHQQVEIDAYVANLKKIATRLKNTGATVIWCQTTPVPEGSAGRIAGDSKRYNEAAAKAMAEVGGVLTNPLYDYALGKAELQRKANVHYTPEGSEALGEQVATIVREALAKRQQD